MKLPLSVLMVEDSEDDAELILRELARGGYEVRHRRVQTQEDMLRALREESWNLILSDFSMPAFSGPGALTVWKESKLEIPFIIVSGTIGEETAAQSLRAGANDFLVKGRLARLIPAIQRELREAEGRRQERIAQEERARVERLLLLVSESVPDGVVVADMNGKFVLWNDAATAILGNGPAEIPVRNWPEHYGIYLGDKVTPCAPGESPLARALRGEAVDGLDLFVRNPKRGDTWINVNARPLRDEHGNPKGAVAVFRDVTQERKTQEQLLVSDRMASVGILAAGLAHEINNPLASVVANLELAAVASVQLARAAAPDNKAEHDELAKEIREASEATERIRRIIKDVKIFSRAQDEEKRDVINVEDVLESSLRMAWNEIRHRAQLVRKYDRVPRVFGNESRLGQVFLNLVVNAAHAIPEGRAENNEITVATRLDGQGRVVVEVRDTGTGISPDAMKRLFMPFFTTKPLGVGTGLGLSICHRIVSDMGGEILVQSQVGRGATFAVHLPAAPRTAAPERAKKVSEAPVANNAAKTRGRLMVVDDDQMITEVLRRMFGREHDVVIMNAARDALAKIAAGERFGVILCDLMMPEMSGADLHAELARIAPDQAEKMIFLTGGAFTPHAIEFLDSVKNMRIEKPFEGKELRAIVNERLSSS